jgi:5-methylcytosine-specific restriction endonuclease McrA
LTDAPLPEVKARRRRGGYSKTRPYKRVYESNHYREKGLPFDLFMSLSQLPCYYCGQQPTPFNIYGAEYDPDSKLDHNRRISRPRWEAGWIAYNGVDKKSHSEDYSDPDNLVSCCRRCNFMKQRLDAETFITHAQKISDHQKK